MFKNLFGLGVSVGSKAPGFALIDQKGSMRRLKDFQGQWVVLFFYPKDGTPGCTAELCSFRDSLDSLKDLEAVVLGVSTDHQEKHKNFSKKLSLNFPILSDYKGTVARDYRVLLPLKIANRVTFIIDPRGVIREKIRLVNNSSYGSIVREKLQVLQESKAY